MKKKLLLFLGTISFFLSNYTMNRNEKFEVAITVNSVGGTAHYYTPLPPLNNDAPLSSCGKIIAGIYTTGCGVATTASIAAVDYFVINFAATEGLEPSGAIALGICSGLATAIGGLIVWYGGYRYVRSCLPRATNINNIIVEE